MADEAFVAEKQIYRYSRAWGKKRAEQLNSNFARMLNYQTGKALGSIGVKVRKKGGYTESISFSTVRYAMILAAGSEPYKLASGAMHPGVTAKDWITPAIAPYQKELADYVAAKDADSVVKTLNFSTNG